MTTTPIACPRCTHEATMRARRRGEQADIDEFALMRWHPPSQKAGAQVCTRWDDGFWVCDICELRLNPIDAGILLDAALMHYAPDCDSIGADGIHADTHRALAGGPRS